MAAYTLISVSAAVGVAVATASITIVGNSPLLLWNDLAYLPITLHYSKADYTLIYVSATVAVATAPITIAVNSALYYGMT